MKMKKLIALAAVIAAPFAMANGVQATSASVTAEATVAQTCTVEVTSGSYDVNYGDLVTMKAKTNAGTLVSAKVKHDPANENLAGDEKLYVNTQESDLDGASIDVSGSAGELEIEVGIDSASVKDETAKAGDYAAKVVIDIECAAL